jgi:hypothetical protein
MSSIYFNIRNQTHSSLYSSSISFRKFCSCSNASSVCSPLNQIVHCRPGRHNSKHHQEVVHQCSAMIHHIHRHLWMEPCSFYRCTNLSYSHPFNYRSLNQQDPRVQHLPLNISETMPHFSIPNRAQDDRLFL